MATITIIVSYLVLVVFNFVSSLTPYEEYINRHVAIVANVTDNLVGVSIFILSYSLT